MGIPTTETGMEALCVAFTAYWMEKYGRLPAQNSPDAGDLAQEFRKQLEEWALAYHVACDVFPVEEEPKM